MVFWDLSLVVEVSVRCFLMDLLLQCDSDQDMCLLSKNNMKAFFKFLSEKNLPDNKFFKTRVLKKKSCLMDDESLKTVVERSGYITEKLGKVPIGHFLT